MRFNKFSRLVVCILATCLSLGCTPPRMDNLQGILDEKPPTQMPESIDEDLQRFQLDAAVFETSNLQSETQTETQPEKTESPKFKLAPIDPVILSATTEAPPTQVMSKSLQPILSKASAMANAAVPSPQTEPAKSQKDPIILTAQATQLKTSPSTTQEQIRKPLPGQFIVPDFSDPRQDSDSQNEIALPAAAVADQPDLPKTNEIEASDVAMQRQPVTNVAQREFLSPAYAKAKENINSQTQPQAELVKQVESEVVVEIPDASSGDSQGKLSQTESDQLVDDMLAYLDSSVDVQAVAPQCPKCNSSEGCNCQSTNPDAVVLPELPENELAGNSWVDAELPVPTNSEPPRVQSTTPNQFEIQPAKGDFIPVAKQSMAQAENEFQPNWNVPDPQPQGFVEQASGTESANVFAPEATPGNSATESQTNQMERLADQWLALPKNATPLLELKSEGKSEFERELKSNVELKSNMEPKTVPPAVDIAPKSQDWKTHLRDSIELLKNHLDQHAESPESSQQQVLNVRLLRFLESRLDGFDNADLSPEMRDYWDHQTSAISKMLESSLGAESNPIVQHKRAVETLVSLRNAVSELEKIANLRLIHPEFCTAVSGYGQTTPVEHTQFQPAQKVLVYCEVENFTSQVSALPTGNSYRTRLRGSIAIYDHNGHVVQQAEFPSVEDIASNRRRDFYMYLPVAIADLPTGKYKMHLMVEDVNGNKTASLDQPLSFTIK